MQPVRYQIRLVIAAYLVVLGTYQWFSTDGLLEFTLNYLMMFAGLLIARDAWADRRAQHTEFSPDHDPADQGAQR